MVDSNANDQKLPSYLPRKAADYRGYNAPCARHNGTGSNDPDGQLQASHHPQGPTPGKKQDKAQPNASELLKFSFHGKHVEINMPTRAALKSEVRRRFEANDGFALATLNLDHIAKLKACEKYAQAYQKQDLVIADGWPIVALSRLARKPIELMPGSDMILPLCRLAAETNTSVAFVGSTDKALAAAATRLMARVPGLQIVLTLAPSMVFSPESHEAEDIFRQLNESGAGLCFLALGAPKQEITAALGRRLSPSVGFVSIGAGLDFLGGQQMRAPWVIRRVGMEWFWRALTHPRRLLPRYMRCFAILPGRIAEVSRQRRS